MKTTYVKSILKICVSTLALGLLTTTHVYAGDGKATYDKACFACHKTGVMGAPKLGDKKDWKNRIAQGNETLYKHAIKGFKGKKGSMPAKGGRPEIVDADVKSAVDYMVKQAS